jgi:TonB family protein
MSKDPKPKQAPPPAAPETIETLEDAVYRPSLSESNKELRGTNPLIAVPTAIVTYVLAAGLIFFVATKTEAGKKALAKTTGIILDEGDDKEDVEDLPPPPPPSAPVMALAKGEIKDVPPPPPLNDQEVVPDVAPKVIPTIDYSKTFAQKADEGAVSGLGTTVGSGGGLGTTSHTAVIEDIDSTNVTELYRPPMPKSPPLAERAKVSGRVRVELIIGTDGSVQSAKVLSGQKLLHQHAMDWAKTWKFTPYVSSDGHAKIARFVINMDYKL